MRILTFSESDLQGGAERAALDLSLALRERGHHVEFLGPVGKSGWLGGEFVRHGFATHGYRLDRAVDVRALREVRRLVRDGRFDVVHAHQFAAVVYAAAVHALGGPAVISTMHGLGTQTAVWRRRAVLRWAMRSQSTAVAVSEDLAVRLQAELRLAPGTIHVVPNGVSAPLGDAGRVRAELGLSPDTRLLLCVGNLISFKGHDVLLRALRDSPLPLPWHLAIAGREENNSPAVHALLAEPSLAGRVSLLGARNDVAHLLAAADLFVHPSVEEGLPLAILEAMMASRPIVASGVGGIPEAVRDGVDALLVPPRDEAALAAAVHRVLTDPALGPRLGQAARARAMERFSLEAMANAYERLYQSVSGGHRATA